MATLKESMDLLKGILGRGCTPEERRRYEIEWRAYHEVLNGDPFDETNLCHAMERGIYRETRARAELQRTVHGTGKEEA